MAAAPSFGGAGFLAHCGDGGCGPAIVKAKSANAESVSDSGQTATRYRRHLLEGQYDASIQQYREALPLKAEISDHSEERTLRSSTKGGKRTP